MSRNDTEHDFDDKVGCVQFLGLYSQHDTENNDKDAFDDDGQKDMFNFLVH